MPDFTRKLTILSCLLFAGFCFWKTASGLVGWADISVSSTAEAAMSPAFSHNVLNFYVEGEETPIGVTAGHPIWSEDRQAFVHSEKLQIGERLRSAVGRTVCITSIEVRAVPEPVYNLEATGPNPNNLRMRIVDQPTDNVGVYLKPHDVQLKVSSAGGSNDDFYFKP